MRGLTRCQLPIASALQHANPNREVLVTVVDHQATLPVDNLSPFAKVCSRRCVQRMRQPACATHAPASMFNACASKHVPASVCQ